MPEKKYDLSKEPEKTTEEKIDEVLNTKNLDENNPLERAKKFVEVKKNPPKPDYMKIEVFEGDDNGEPIVVSKSTDKDDTEVLIEHDPFFTIDLKTLIDADVAACPSNVVPMLIDQAVQLAMNEKITFKPKKRKDEFNWWWVVMGLLMLPGIFLIVILFFGGG